MEENKKIVSVVIPCRNEENYIGQCIESIINQSYGIENIEIIVVDGMSDDKTLDIIKKYEETYTQIKIINNEKKITPVAMNIGIRHSKGDIVMIFGAHSYMHKDYIKRVVEDFERDNVDCVGGRIINISENKTAQAIAQAMSSPFGVGNALFRFSKTKQLVDTVAFAAYKRDIFDKIGYFDEEFVRNQDDEINFRLIKSGGKILLDPDIISYYYTRGSYKKLWKQYYQYGFWKVRVIQKHKKPASLRHLVPVFFVCGLALGAFLSIFSKLIGYLYAIVLLIYLILGVAFSIKASDKNYNLVFKILFAFLILHTSYGVGFLEGLYVFYISKDKNKIDKNKKLSR
ncbi:glycosyltransferase family 2 protein [Caloramator sp. E03]|uniref:glycosyltransferase family 2 protein n=1 Tax=Caloramator sp. E03 TaxID=2576307 RepID=UPI0011101E5A|nr:glycosyltransferase family 2 protein [Caloramator sp. E03]QCX32827.1 glycosyltransferase family 2 protein [Caloramator sp. E03]